MISSSVTGSRTWPGGPNTAPVPAAILRGMAGRLLGRASAPVVIGLETPVRAMEIIEPGVPEAVRFAERDEPAPRVPIFPKVWV
jgi:hypothetical protein